MPDSSADPASAADPASPRLQAAISDTVSAFLATQQGALAAAGPDLDDLFEVAERALEGGKRLRAAFVYWGWRAAGGAGSDLTCLLNCAAAVELVHASALVHDDLIDGSDTRRGHPSAQRDFAGRVPDAVEGTAEPFGVAAALLLGDLLLAWSDELYNTSGFRPKVLRRGRPAFDRLRREVVAGQYLDVLAQTRRRSSAADAMRVVLYKSAKYTVERPLQLGASLAQADTALLGGLSSYGVPLGQAFQLRDDMLGVFGDSAVTGKPAGDDLREGKRTLLVARAFDRADRAQRTTLDSLFGRQNLEQADVARLQDVLRDTGAVAAVETVIAELTDAALAGLRGTPIQGSEPRAALETLAALVTDRTA